LALEGPLSGVQGKQGQQEKQDNGAVVYLGH